MEFISIGSGDGWFTLQIAKIARRVVAIDIDPNLLEVSRHRLAEYGATNCDYVAGDADELAKLVPRLADFVFMATAFHGVPDRSRLALAVRGVLRPGGLFTIVNWHQRPREETVVLGEPRGPKTELRMSPERTIEAVDSSGLKLAHLVEVPPYHYGAVFERCQPESHDAFRPRRPEYFGSIGLPACCPVARGTSTKGAGYSQCPAGVHSGPGWRPGGTIAADGRCQAVRRLALLSHRTPPFAGRASGRYCGASGSLLRLSSRISPRIRRSQALWRLP
jgi:Methyltransferase domain